MKKIIPLFCIIILVSCSENKKVETNKKSNSEVQIVVDDEEATTHPSKYSSELNGIWIPIRQEMNGKPIPENKFSKTTLEFIDTNFVLTAEVIDKGVVKYFGNQMDFYVNEGKRTGKHYKAIYKVENDLLYICYDLTGQNYPGEFSSTAGKNDFLAVFKRQ